MSGMNGRNYSFGLILFQVGGNMFMKNKVGGNMAAYTFHYPQCEILPKTLRRGIKNV